MNRFLISDCKVVRDGKLSDAQLLISRGKIEAVLSPSEPVDESHPRLSAGGHLVVPGGIDPHVHLHLPTPAGPSSDDFETGTRAALAGGTTSVIDFVTPARGESLVEALKNRREEAKPAVTDVAFHVGITWWNETVPEQMRMCVEKEGIRSFKVYLAYRNTIGIGYDELRQVLRVAAGLGVVVAIHAEEGDRIDVLRDNFVRQGKVSPLYHALSRPPETEIAAVKRVIDLVRDTGCMVYFVHISTAGAALQIERAKKEGLPVFAETCIQYLVLDEKVYDRPFNLSAPYVISPPVRSAADVAGLWEALAGGVFDVVSTDHCPFNLAGQKDAGRDDFRLIPNGAGGIEYRLQLLYSYGVEKEKLTLKQWIDLCSGNAARIFSLAGKGEIAPGYDADLVIWNAVKRSVIDAETQYQRCDSNIYNGIEVAGSPELVVRSGVVYRRHDTVLRSDLPCFDI